MRAHAALVLLALFAAIASARGCEPKEIGNFCRIVGMSCHCGYMCKSETSYRTRRACTTALRETNSNKCLRTPCLMGICIQTTQDPGYICKCEGTGTYGQRCEKLCPLAPQRDAVFPHECVVI